jgi:hypothetical protein
MFRVRVLMRSVKRIGMYIEHENGSHYDATGNVKSDVFRKK